MKLKFLLATLFLSTPLLLVSQAQAQWTLDNESSRLSFVTTKAEHVAEVHTFDVLSGSLSASGEVSITIELASVNTMIPIRNERMQAMLFETNLFPRATISAQVNTAAMVQLSPGSSVIREVEFQLDLHGDSHTYTAEVLIMKTEDGVIASTLKPIIVTADTFGLLDGVERLREVAGLPGISRAVPVSFTVSFE